MENNWSKLDFHNPAGDLIFTDAENHKNLINKMYDLLIYNSDDEKFLQKTESFLTKDKYFLFQRTIQDNWNILKTYSGGRGFFLNFSDNSKNAKCYISTTDPELEEIIKNSYTEEDVSELENLDLINVKRDKKNEIKSIETNLNFDPKNIENIPFVFLDEISKPLSLRERESHYSLLNEKYSITQDIENYIKYVITDRPNSERKKNHGELALQQTNFKQKKIKIANLKTPSKKLMVINIAPRDYNSYSDDKFSEYCLDVPDVNTILYECYDESYKKNITQEKILEKQENKNDGYYPKTQGSDPKNPNIHFIYFDISKTDKNISI